MRNYFFILSILLLIVGIALSRYRTAAFDTEAILKEQHHRIEADFQQRAENARQVFLATQPEALFTTVYNKAGHQPDYAFYRYDSTGYTAWTYEGFSLHSYTPFDEGVSYGMGVVGVVQRQSEHIWSYIPAYIPDGSSFDGWTFRSKAVGGKFPVRTKKGLLVQYLSRGSVIKDSARSWRVLLALSLFFLIFSFWLLTGARLVRAARGVKDGATFLLGGLLAFGLGYYFLEFDWALRGINLFSGEAAVGSRLVYSILFLWASTVFFRRFNREEETVADSNLKRGIAWTNYSLSLLGLFILAIVLDYPFSHWSDFVDQHILNFNLKGAGILLFASLMVLSYFFFTYRLALNTDALGLKRNERLVILTVSILVFGLLVLGYEGKVMGLQLALVGFIYLVLFDFFLDSDSGSLTWMISWIFALSLLLTLLFIHYNKGGSEQMLTLFSLFFSIIILLILVLAVANTVIRAVSISELFPMLWGASLRNKIQLYVTILTLGSFVAIGLVTTNSFNKYNQEKESADHLSLVESVMKMLADNPRPKNVDDMYFSVRKMSDLLGGRINLYNQNGRLGRGRADFFTPFMQASAFEQLKKPDVGFVNTVAQSPKEKRKTTYIPIRKADNSYFGAIGIPYDKTTSSRIELMDFLGDLLTVYIFLLLIVSSLSIVIANLITKPISQLGQKLKDVSLDGNESLEWQGDDEIGQLVNNYNAMIVKLEKSTTLLRQSEREGAWREMAKQVAHEIKNPLTPMKLSIQHLMRVYEADPEQAAPLVKRVSKTLIDQINGLVTIADEFSNFAKMPKANPEDLSLSNLIESVVDLFAAKPENKPVQIITELPEEEIFIKADKNHLTRIFNNLIKNAIQAIPDDRQGEIKVKLFRQAKEVLVQVSDNGEGIPEEIQSKVFQPNFTTKSSGTGIGLAMTKNMVENTGGSISFQTQIGIGTIFAIRFPS